MNDIKQIKQLLHDSITIPQEKHARFFKTGVGQYAQHDTFIGVNVPTLRTIAKKFQDISLVDLEKLITSQINEERLLALFILIHQYKKADCTQKNKLYTFYMRHIKHINNWNLVDASAHSIVGAHIQKDKSVLIKLAHSKNIWERRIAIVATWYFIRSNECSWTFKIAHILLADSHDLIHKAVGWMLREAGKRNQDTLITFLDQHAHYMPRTMLRYAIEKFPTDLRTYYLKKE